jgi:hypothetical protein
VHDQVEHSGERSCKSESQASGAWVPQWRCG